MAPPAHATARDDLARARRNPFASTPHWPLLLARALCGLAGVWCYFVALGSLNLADASLLKKFPF